MRKRSEYEIVRIGEMNGKELRSEYLSIFGTEAPIDVTRGLLRSLLCYEVRLKAIGGLTPEQKKLFAKVIKEEEPKRGRIWNYKAQFKVGTRLRRLWKGKTYQIVCEQDGFSLEGNVYKSLSEVARAITGTRWNGYTFFGIESPSSRRAARAAA